MRTTILVELQLLTRKQINPPQMPEESLPTAGQPFPVLPTRLLPGSLENT